MIYVPVNIESGLIRIKDKISIQYGLTNSYPEIVFELHKSCGDYFDIGDSYTVSAYITNTCLESKEITGDISVMNPHRGQIVFKPSSSDFTMTGLNTITVICELDTSTVSFQSTIFVDTISKSVLELIKSS